MPLPMINSDFRAAAMPNLKQITRKDGTLATVLEVRVAASNRRFNAKTQAWEDGDRLFIDVEYFGDDGAVLVGKIATGTQLYISGELKLHEWKNKDGETRSKHSIKARKLRPLVELPTFNGSPAGAGYVVPKPSTNDEPPF
ncbi:single-stranded DNA-binding protein [Corynebacterium phoceense]|uniref:single-stranded DNA-binding protein n=1 Tax=Corynebacterium phoceense TaxID=1686286 RepID=UPI000A06C63F|nr:single-stranded DNA-binding protein [Corynebacterium phoceense]MBF9011692.1 single-stranded DNA-binding protein [Corynebacterium phoceense]